jgi:hypothetical protein
MAGNLHPSYSGHESGSSYDLAPLMIDGQTRVESRTEPAPHKNLEQTFSRADHGDVLRMLLAVPSSPRPPIAWIWTPQEERSPSSALFCRRRGDASRAAENTG